MANNDHSPIAKVPPHHAPYNRPEMQKSLKGSIQQVETLYFLESELFIDEETLTQLSQIQYPKPHRSSVRTHKDQTNFLVEYGLHVSIEIKKTLASPDDSVGDLLFADTGSRFPRDHPTSTRAMPDITVFFDGTQDKSDGRPFWSRLESLSEIHSTGTKIRDSLDKTNTYAAYLLQARPDRVSVLSFHTGNRGISFLISDVTGSRSTCEIGFEEWPLFQLLFCAFVYRLYVPHLSMIDPSITRAIPSEEHPDPSLFHIELPQGSGQSTARYRLSHVGHPYVRRSTVFRSLESGEAITIDGQRVDIIKEQYIPLDRRFQETEIIEHIHKDGSVPGVVQMIYYEDVLRDDSSPIELDIIADGRAYRQCKKVRIAECDMGKPLIGALTLRDLLIGLYDLLETIRFLFLRRNVLHRDISTGNVMCMPVLKSPKQDSSSKPSIPPSDLCCAKFLLGEEMNDWTAVTSSLIDFDHGEILDAKTDQPRAGRTGTAVFISRAVLKGHPIPHRGQNYEFPEMPDAPNELYRDLLGSRMTKFPPSDEESIRVRTNVGPHRLWKHELRHDAESVFWLLVYWVIHALPADAVPAVGDLNNDSDAYISRNVWSLLTDSKNDTRSTILYPELCVTAIHSVYDPIKELIQELWGHIATDHYWVLMGPLCEADYVHEAFQRRILSFLIRHHGEDFLTKERNATKNREVDPSDIPAHSDRPLAGIEVLRSSTSMYLSSSQSSFSMTLPSSQAIPQPEFGNPSNINPRTISRMSSESSVTSRLHRTTRDPFDSVWRSNSASNSDIFNSNQSRSPSRPAGPSSKASNSSRPKASRQGNRASKKGKGKGRDISDFSDDNPATDFDRLGREEPLSGPSTSTRSRTRLREHHAHRSPQTPRYLVSNHTSLSGGEVAEYHPREHSSFSSPKRSATYDTPDASAAPKSKRRRPHKGE